MQNQLCLVSPNDISREGLCNIFSNDGFEIVGACRSVVEVDQSEDDDQFLVVVDFHSPNDQVNAVKELKDSFPKAAIVVLAERFDFDSMVHCFHLGAQGYIIKSMNSSPLITSLRLASMGEKVMPSDLADLLDRRPIRTMSAAEGDEDIDRANLSHREMDVLCCLMAGYSNKVIARQLDVCEATVKVHVKAILRKLKVNNRTQAAIWATSHGLSETALLS